MFLVESREFPLADDLTNRTETTYTRRDMQACLLLRRDFSTLRDEFRQVMSSSSRSTIQAFKDPQLDLQIIEAPAVSSNTDTPSPTQYPPSSADINLWKQSRRRIQNLKIPRILCREGCDCNCHKPMSISTPQMFRFIFGSIRMAATHIPLPSRCHTPACARRAAPLLTVNILLPRWLISRMVSVVMRLSQAQGPELLLRVYRRIPYSSDIVRSVFDGNLEQFKVFLSQNQVLVNDVTGLAEGYPLLVVSTK